MWTGRRRMKPWQKWWCHAPLSKENYVIQVISFAKCIRLQEEGHFALHQYIFH